MRASFHIPLHADSVFALAIYVSRQPYTKLSPLDTLTNADLEWFSGCTVAARPYRKPRKPFKIRVCQRLAAEIISLLEYFGNKYMEPPKLQYLMTDPRGTSNSIKCFSPACMVVSPSNFGMEAASR